MKSYTLLSQHLAELEQGEAANTPINQLRREMSRQCEAFALRPSGVYTLSIPTGGGKTLASMRYALKHAIEHNKERIIYIVPYTTIIEQNAAEIRSILQNVDMILEHHSNVVDDKFEDRQNMTTEKRMRFVPKSQAGPDHWDRPIILQRWFNFSTRFMPKVHAM